MSDSLVPRFAAGMKFRFDTVRERWVVLGPERLFLPDEHAVEILKLVDGQRSLGDIADALAVLKTIQVVDTEVEEEAA